MPQEIPSEFPPLPEAERPEFSEGPRFFNDFLRKYRSHFKIMD